MKRMTIREWIYLGLGMLLGGWMAACGSDTGTLCHAQAASWHPSVQDAAQRNAALQAAGANRNAAPALFPPEQSAVTYYSPETNLENLDVGVLSSAQESIALAAFSLTDQAIVDALKADAARGVKVRIYLDRGELQAECRGDVTCSRIPLHSLIGLPGVEIRVKFSKVLMHLKSYAVDTSMVRDGSANFSEAGEFRQDNSAVFSTDIHALAGFGLKFRAMWARPDNLTVAQAVKEAK